MTYVRPTMFCTCFPFSVLSPRSIPGHSETDTTHLVSYLSSLACHPRLFRHPRSGRVVISTFSGENCHFGKDCLDKGWSHLKQELSVVSPVRPFQQLSVPVAHAIAQVDLVPAFFTDPAQSNCLESIDGVFNVSIVMNNHSRYLTRDLGPSGMAAGLYTSPHHILTEKYSLKPTPVTYVFWRLVSISWLPFHRGFLPWVLSRLLIHSELILTWH